MQYLDKLNSCLYSGVVMHHRLHPISNRFSYRVFCMLLDLDELERLDQQRLFSVNRFNMFSFNEADHGAGQTDLAAYIRLLLSQRGYHSATAQITLLCYPRILGFTFNPISTYFCYNQAGELEIILYQVSNTFGSRHSYLFSVAEGAHSAGEPIRHKCDKKMYVSPFMPMQTSYYFRIQPPNKQVSVSIRQTEADKDTDKRQPLLYASFTGTFRSFTDYSLLCVFFKYPLMTLKVVAGIHWEALKLWRKKLKIQSRLEDQSNSISWQDKSGVSHYERL